MIYLRPPPNEIWPLLPVELLLVEPPPSIKFKLLMLLVSIAPPHSVAPAQPPIGELMPCELPLLVPKPPLKEPAPPFYFC